MTPRLAGSRTRQALPRATRLERCAPGSASCACPLADQIAVVTADHPARACLPTPFTPYDLAKKVHDALTPASAP
jgi:hypothetical protein